jgi:hypothetical protein
MREHSADGSLLSAAEAHRPPDRDLSGFNRSTPRLAVRLAVRTNMTPPIGAAKSKILQEKW